MAGIITQSLTATVLLIKTYRNLSWHSMAYLHLNNLQAKILKKKRFTWFKTLLWKVDKNLTSGERCNYSSMTAHISTLHGSEKFHKSNLQFSIHGVHKWFSLAQSQDQVLFLQYLRFCCRFVTQCCNGSSSQKAHSAFILQLTQGYCSPLSTQTNQERSNKMKNNINAKDL